MWTWKHVLVKNVYKWVKYRFAWVEKTVYGVEAHRLFGKEKVPGVAVSKEGHADSLLRDKRTHRYLISWKRCNCKQCFQLPAQAVVFGSILVADALTRSASLYFTCDLKAAQMDVKPSLIREHMLRGFKQGLNDEETIKKKLLYERWTCYRSE